MFKDSLQEMLNTEFDTVMGYFKYHKTTKIRLIIEMVLLQKKLKSEFKQFDFETPRNKNCEIESKIVSKNKRDVFDTEDKIISLYGRGLTTREINEQIQDLYGI